jgi:YVTN family beta-propeller protein
MRLVVLGVLGLTLVVSVLVLHGPVSASGAADGPSVIATIGVGTYSWGTAVNPDTNLVYTANYQDDTVSVIDGATNTVVATVPVGLWPDGVAVNPNTNRVYVINRFYELNKPWESYGSVSVIDGASNTVVATMPVGNDPADVAVNPNTNLIYVADSYRVYVIDGTSNAIVANVWVGAFPYALAVNPNTNRIYVTNDYESNVAVIDGFNNTVVATIPVDYSPKGLAVDEDRNRVYVTQRYANKVSVIDGATNSVIASMPIGDYPRAVAVDPNRNRVYVVNSTYPGPYLSVIDGNTNTVVATIPVGTIPASVGVNPNMYLVYVTNRGDGNHQSTVSVVQDGVPPTPTATFTPTPMMTPIPTATPRPPLGVGGTVKLSAAAIPAESGVPGEGPGAASNVALAGAVVGGAVMLVAGGWYARRHWQAR